MINQDIVAQDLFYKLRSRFPKLTIGDENGQPTYESKQGRFFDFDAIFDDVNLGRVSISINEAGSLKLYFGRSLLENLDDVLKSTWFNFLKEMRAFAKKRMLSFDTRDIGKTNLDKRDFHYLANKDTVMSESIAYGTNMTSYRPLSKSKIIIRHKTPVTADVPGARSRNIAHIFIQNEDGERYKMKVNHLPTAEAMARHVSHGNQPYDAFGRHIEECGHNIAMLSNFKRYATNHMDKMNPDASDIVTRATSHLENLKNYVRQLGKSSHYMKHRDTFHAPDEAPMELDQATMESYREKFTLRNYNEDLSAVFPLLHKIMGENSEINLEDIVGETQEEKCNECGMYESKCECEHEHAAESIRPELAFEHFADTLIETQMTPEGIQQLQDLLSNGLQAGAGGEAAISALEDLGLNDPKLVKMIEGIGNATPEKNVAGDIVEWMKATNSPILDQLDLNQIPDAQNQPAQSIAGPELEPAQMAEGMKHERYTNLIMKMQNEGLTHVSIANEKYSLNDLRVMSEGVNSQVLQHAKAEIKDRLQSGEMDKDDAITHLMIEFDISDRLASQIVNKLAGSGMVSKHVDDDPRFSAHSEDDYEDDNAFMQNLRGRISSHGSIGMDDIGGFDEMDEGALSDLAGKAISSFAFNPITRVGVAGGALGANAAYQSNKEKEANKAQTNGDSAPAQDKKSEPSDTNTNTKENAGGMGAGSVASMPLEEGHPLMINGKEVDRASLEVDDVDPRDYPDFSDAYISYATFTDGTELSDEEIEELNDRHGDLVHELAYDSLHEAQVQESINRILNLSGLMEAKKCTCDSKPKMECMVHGKVKEAKGAKPDFLDMDKDGDKKEPMKKAVADKKKKPFKNVEEGNDGNLANNAKPYDKVTRGDVIAGRLGKDEMGGKAKAKKPMKENFGIAELQDILKLSGMKKDREDISHKDSDGEELVERPSSMKEVAEFIKSFYNREDGTFPLGETGVRVKVEKKFGERAGEIAEKFIQKLAANGPRRERNEFEDQNGHPAMQSAGQQTPTPTTPNQSTQDPAPVTNPPANPNPTMKEEQGISILRQLAGLR